MDRASWVEKDAQRLLLTHILADLVGTSMPRLWLAASAFLLAHGAAGAAGGSGLDGTRCVPDAVVIVSQHQDVRFPGKPVRARLKGLSDKDAALSRAYPDLRALLLPESEIRAALERGVLDIAAYRCADVLSDASAFLERYKSFNVWILTKTGSEDVRWEPVQGAGQGHAALPQAKDTAQSDKPASESLNDPRMHAAHVQRMHEAGARAYRDRDYAAALRHFSEAAQLGYAPSQYALGLMHQGGDGVAKSDSQAAILFERAAQSGHAGAQFELAKAYLSGRGVPKNTGRAHDLLAKAAAQGHPAAKRLLDIEHQLAANREEAEQLHKRRRELEAELKKLCGGRICEKLADGRYIYRTETYDPPLWYFEDGRLAPPEVLSKSGARQ